MAGWRENSVGRLLGRKRRTLDAQNEAEKSRRCYPGGAPAVLVGAAVMLLLFAGAAGAEERSDPPLPDLTQPLTVDEVIRITLERNLDLAQANEAVAVAHGSRTSSLSGLLPGLGADYSFSRRGFNSTGRAVVDPVTGEVFLVNAGTTYTSTWALSVSGRTNLIDLPSINNYRQAGHGEESARQSFAAARNAAVLNAEQQYYAVIGTQQLAAVNEEAYTLAQDQLRRAQSLFELGSVARSDVLQAQVNLASAERDRIAGQNRIEQQRSSLAVLMGIPVGAPVKLAEPAPPDTAPPPPEADLIRQAETARPEVLRAEQDLEAARMAEASARALRYPSLGGGYSYSKTGPSRKVLDPQEVNKNANWGFDVGLSLPIFNGFSTKGRIQQTSAEVRARQEALDQSKLQVALDVRQAVLSIKNGIEEIRSATQGVSFAEESVRLQRALYENGGGTLLEWNNAQVELTRARQALVAAQISLRLAQASLQNAIGAYAHP
jgi:outer membrane protein